MYIERLGQSQYFLQFDEEFRERLFAVQGEIGRTYLFSILDKDKKIVLNPKISLSMVVQNVAGNTKPTFGELLQNGQYKITLPQTALYFPGTATYQLRIEENLNNEVEYRFLASKQSIIVIEENVDFTSKDNENFIFQFMEFKKKMALIDEIIEDADKILQETIEARDMALHIIDNIDLAGSVLDKADLINALLLELETKLAEAEIDIILSQIEEKNSIHYRKDNGAIISNAKKVANNDLLIETYELENEGEMKLSRSVNGSFEKLYDSKDYVRKLSNPLVYELLNYFNSETNETIILYSNGVCEYWGYRSPLITIRIPYGTSGLFYTTYQWDYPLMFSVPPSVVVNEARYSTGASWGSVRYSQTNSCNLLLVDSHYRPAVGHEVLATYIRIYARGMISEAEQKRLIERYKEKKQ